MAFQPGERVGDYEVLHPLGGGGMGAVFKVRNVISDRVEAMKVLLPNLREQAELADRFLREIRVQARLSHPNIAGLHTSIRHGEQLLMFMEFVEGTSIESMLKRGPVPVEQAVNYTRQVLDALTYAHAVPVIHRDIKPANIMVTPAGTAKLLDFGIAVLTTDKRLTRTGMTMGSIYYMPPEQIKGQDLDARADLYSLGVTLYEMLVGRRPFEGETDYVIFNAHLNVAPEPPAVVANVPPAISDVVLKAMAKDPAQRFQTAAEFKDALNRALAGGTQVQRPVQKSATKPIAVAAPVVAAVQNPPPPVTPRNNALMIGVAAGLVVVLGAAGLYMWQRPQEEPRKDETIIAKVDPPRKEVQPPGPAGSPGVLEKVEPPPVRDVPAKDSPKKRDEPPKLPPAEREKASAERVLTAPPKTETAPPVARTEELARTLQAPPGSSPATQPADPQLEQLGERMTKLAARVAAVQNKIMSIERTLPTGFRSDAKIAQGLMLQFMGQATRALQTGNAPAAKTAMDKAEIQVERLEEILGM